MTKHSVSVSFPAQNITSPNVRWIFPFSARMLSKIRPNRESIEIISNHKILSLPSIIFNMPHCFQLHRLKFHAFYLLLSTSSLFIIKSYEWPKTWEQIIKQVIFIGRNTLFTCSLKTAELNVIGIFYLVIQKYLKYYRRNFWYSKCSFTKIIIDEKSRYLYLKPFLIRRNSYK